MSSGITGADQDLRLQCLRIAIEARAADPVAEAKRYLAFVEGKSEPRECAAPRAPDAR